MKNSEKLVLKATTALVLTASLTHAAVVFDGSGGNSSASTTPLTWSHTVTATTDSILLVSFSYEDASTNVGAVPSSITYGSQSLTPLLATTASNPGGENTLGIWYLLNPTAGASTITFAGLTIDTAANLVRGSSVSFSGSSEVPTLFQTDANTDSSAPTVSFTGILTDSALYAIMAYSASGTAQGTTAPVLTFPTGGSFTGGQAAHHAGYNLNVSGDFTAGSTSTSARSAMGAVILSTTVPEPSSVLLGALGVLGLLRRRRA